MIRKYSVEPSTSIGGPSYSASCDFKVKESSSSFFGNCSLDFRGELGGGLPISSSDILSRPDSDHFKGFSGEFAGKNTQSDQVVSEVRRIGLGSVEEKR